MSRGPRTYHPPLKRNTTARTGANLGSKPSARSFRIVSSPSSGLGRAHPPHLEAEADKWIEFVSHEIDEAKGQHGDRVGHAWVTADAPGMVWEAGQPAAAEIMVL